MNSQRELPLRYPDSPGYKRSGTSKDAARSMLGAASTLRNLVMQELRIRSGSADNIAHRLKKDILSIRPRFSELLEKGLIRDSGHRTKNDSGKSATIWEVV